MSSDIQRVELDDAATFEKTARAIAQEIFSRGMMAVRLPDPLTLLEGDDEDLKRTFLVACHDGYAEAQRRIGAEIQRIQKATAEANAARKTARKLRDRNRQVQAEAALWILRREEQVLRRLADSIAWMLAGDRRWIVRRFFRREKPPSLVHSRYADTLRVAEGFREDDPTRFALVSDITSVVQVGDLLVASRGGSLKLVELKTGKVNRVVDEILQKFDLEHRSAEVDNVRANHGDSVAAQTERVLRQQARMTNIAEVINTDYGLDPLTGHSLMLSKDIARGETYDSAVHDLLKIAQEEGSAFRIIDECLDIGIYDTSKVPLAEMEFNHHAYHDRNPEATCRESPEMSDEGFLDAISPRWPVFNVGQMLLEDSMSRPLFLRPFEMDDIFDIIFGRLVILTSLRFDRFIDLCNASGTPLRWGSDSEGRVARRLAPDVLMINGRHLRVQNSTEWDVIVGPGIIHQVVAEGVRPTSGALMLGRLGAETMDRASGWVADGRL
ncbi:MAG: hypothetical protein R3B97_01445 [Dehalococcoidia bacterium]|nr:hypothetical protein [Dehalococcoidia bacterium]